MNASVLPASGAEPAVAAEAQVLDRTAQPEPEAGPPETGPRGDASAAGQGAAGDVDTAVETSAETAVKTTAEAETAAEAEGSGAVPQTIRVMRDDEPLVRLEIAQIDGPQLSDLRAALAARQLIAGSDTFVDASQFPVPGDLEHSTPCERVLSPERTLRLQASGRGRAQRAQ